MGFKKFLFFQYLGICLVETDDMVKETVTKWVNRQGIQKLVLRLNKFVYINIDYVDN